MRYEYWNDISTYTARESDSRESSSSTSSNTFTSRISSDTSALSYSTSKLKLSDTGEDDSTFCSNRATVCTFRERKTDSARVCDVIYIVIRCIRSSKIILLVSKVSINCYCFGCEDCFNSSHTRKN